MRPRNRTVFEIGSARHRPHPERRGRRSVAIRSAVIRPKETVVPSSPAACKRRPASSRSRSHREAACVASDSRFFEGRPIVDLELTVDAGGGATVAAGAQNVLDTYPDESARDVGGREVQRVHAVGLQRRLLTVALARSWQGRRGRPGRRSANRPDREGGSHRCP